MCLYECFGFHKHRDDSWDAPLPAPATKPRGGYGAPQLTYNVNGVHQTDAEALHKAANDVRKFPAAEALKQPASMAAAHGAQQQHHYNYYEREPVHKEDAVDYHYSAASATTDHERY